MHHTVSLQAPTLPTSVQWQRRLVSHARTIQYRPWPARTLALVCVLPDTLPGRLASAQLVLLAGVCNLAPDLRVVGVEVEGVECVAWRVGCWK